MAVGGASVPAQAQYFITVRVLDAKTGHPIEVSNYQVSIDQQQEVHANWVNEKDDKSALMWLPLSASTFSLHVTYEHATETYVNCDSAGDKPVRIDRWYKISDVVTSGVVAPNACSKLKEIAKPSEFVLFVRKPNMREKMHDDAQ